jgi:hypothetical protein
MTVKIGDVFWLMVTNPRINESEERPVVVYALNGENLLIASFATITTSGIEDFDGRFDKWKSPIFNWRDAGLREPSYIKANCVASVNKAVFSSNDYMGEMSRTDLKNATIKIKEFINSDEEAW